MRILLILAALPLAACSTTAQAGGPDATYTSAKAPAEIAACIDDTLRATKSRQVGPGHYEATRKNGFGMVMVRWDIRATPTGSAVEFNDRLGINSGREKAERCF